MRRVGDIVQVEPKAHYRPESSGRPGAKKQIPEALIDEDQSWTSK
jgi:hypothetical protein